MKDVLVVSYSLGGTTRNVADEIAERMSADSACITDVQARNGVRGYLKSCVETLAKGVPAVRSNRDPADYEMVILGTPVWFSSIASPMRSFLLTQGQRCKRAALFCTMAGSNGQGALSEMEAFLGAVNLPTLALRDSTVRDRRHTEMLRTFISQVSRSMKPSIAAMT